MRLPLLALLAVAVLAGATGASELYVPAPSWAASMAATRNRVLETRLLRLELSPWRLSDPARACALADAPFGADPVTADARAADGRPAMRHSRRLDDGRPARLEIPAGHIVYLSREIHVGEACEATFRLDCDRPARFWLGEELLLAVEGNAPTGPNGHEVRRRLGPGRHLLLVKVFASEAGAAIYFDLPEMRLNHATVMEALCRRFWEDFAAMDWFLQDSPTRPTRADGFAPPRDLGWYFEPTRDASGEQQLILRVLEELGPAGTALRAQRDRLIARQTAAGDPAWLELYERACLVRRRARLAALVSTAPQFVFAAHFTMGGSHYAYTEGLSDAQAERHFRPGSRLCLARWDGERFAVETLIDDPRGVIRDPDVSFDGRRVLFAWKKSDREDDYHLYEMDLASRGIRQLTEGLGVADYEGIYLPDGDILFNSTRCIQIVDCWWTEVSNLYRCDGDGRFLRRLTFDQVHTNYPTVTDDGRILYTRWEYNDRGQVYPQPLMQMNPDGTNQSDFYGGSSWFPTTILHARGIPGTQKVAAIATGHHSRQTGKLIVIDPALGRQENEGVQLVAPVRETPAVRIDAYGQDGELFQYPFPLSESEMLVGYHPMGWRWAAGHGPRFGIYWMHVDGRRERLARDGEWPCNRPVVVAPRTAHVRPRMVDYRQSEGVCYVQDVYEGPGLSGVARGTVKRLRVVSLDFRAAGIGSNNNGGPGGGALVSTPVAVGNGAWDPKVVHGDADVHEDGSAMFRVPARTPVYFQLLDEQGRMVQTMRSWTTLQPGETASCVGCHEHKNRTPAAQPSASLAMRRPPQVLKPFYGPPRGFSFAREIQPILDAKCVGCHDGREGPTPGLSSRAIEDRRAKRWWSEAYLALTHARPDDAAGQAGWRGNADHPLVNWISAQSAPPMLPPNAAGAVRSGLLSMLEEGHEGVVLTREELEKLAAWIDLGVPFCGDYVEANAWNDAERAKYDHFLQKRRHQEELEAANLRALIEAVHPELTAVD